MVTGGLSLQNHLARDSRIPSCDQAGQGCEAQSAVRIAGGIEPAPHFFVIGALIQCQEQRYRGPAATRIPLSGAQVLQGLGVLHPARVEQAQHGPCSNELVLIFQQPHPKVGC